MKKRRQLPFRAAGISPVIFLSAVVLLFSAGCARAAENMLPSTDTAEQSIPSASETPTASPAESEVLISKDGVSVHWMAEMPACDLPTLTVVPHSFTSDEAECVAYALFGDAVYYEHRGGVRTMTKSDIEKSLTVRNKLLEDGVLEAIYGDQPELIAEERETIQSFIREAKAACDTAPEPEERTETDWSFHPEEYFEGLTDFAPDGNVSVMTDVISGSVTYTFSATNRERGDFYVNALSAYPSAGHLSPALSEDALFRTENSYECYPTAEEMKNAREKAEKLLAAFGIGEWKVDRCGAKERALNPDKPIYTIEIRAVPVINGTAVLRQQQPTYLNGESGRNWYYPDASFEFGRENRLMDFKLYSPADITEATETAVISPERAAAALKNDIAQRNLCSVFVSVGQAKQDIYVHELRFGYRRTDSENGEFLYVPCVTAMVSLKDRTMYGEVLEDGDTDALYPLVTADLTDGSVFLTKIL